MDHRSRLSGDRRLRIALLVCLTLFSAAKSAGYATTLSLFSPSDEPQHHDYVARLATGRGIPVVGTDPLLPEQLRTVRDSPFYQEALGAAGDPAGRGRVPLQPEAFGATGQSYEGIQPPLGYIPLVPFYLAPVDDGPAKVTIVRLGNGLVASAIVPVTYHLVLSVVPGGVAIALVSAGITGSIQAVSANGGTVNNDAASLVMGAAAILAILRARKAQDDDRRWLLAGAATGAALAVKATLLFVGVWLAWAALAEAWRRRERWADALRPLLSGVVAAVVIAPWVAFNWLTYGAPTSSEQAERITGQFQADPMALTVKAVGRQLWVLSVTYWSSPHGPIPAPTRYDLLCLWMLAIGVVGCLALALRRGADGRAGLILLAGACLYPICQLGIIYALGGSGLLIGRHAIATVPLLVGAAVIGIGGLLPPRARPYLATLMIAVLLLVDARVMARSIWLEYL